MARFSDAVGALIRPLLRHLYGRQYPLVSLEPQDVRLAALNDPRGFLNLYPPPAIFDEIQYAPALLPYIKPGRARSSAKVAAIFELRSTIT